jgi:hypothetical protein
VLFIFGTAAGIASVIINAPIFNGGDLLAKVYAHQTRLLLGGMAVLSMGFALAMTAAVMYPILNRHNRVLAIGYVIFRGAIERLVEFLMVLCWIFLIVISRDAVSARAGSVFDYEALGRIFVKAVDFLSSLGTVVFAIDAVMLYVILFQSRLLPRWISVWGLIAIALHFSTAYLIMFGGVDPSEPYLTVINLPIMVQEMVMAVWMIAKGFNEGRLPKSIVGNTDFKDLEIVD